MNDGRSPGNLPLPPLYDGRVAAPRRLGRRIAIAVALVTLVASAGGIWYAYSLTAVPSGPPIVIMADPSPVKIVPENPGGMVVEHQDKKIFEQLTGRDEKAGTERLLPPPERPNPEPVARAESPPPQPSPAPTQPPAAPPPPQETAATAAPLPTPSLPPQGQKPETAAPPAPVPPMPPQAAPSPPLQAATPTVGSARIQLGAFRSEAEAAAAWSKIKAKHADVGKLTQFLERADLGERGVFYRLQAGPFADRAQAQALCDKLKGQGQACVLPR